MKCLKTILLLFYCAGLPAAWAQKAVPTHQETYSRLRIFLDNPNTIAELAELGLAVDHGEKESQQSFVGEFSRSEINLIKGKYRYEVLVEDLETYYAQRIKKDLLLNRPVSQAELFPCNFTTPANFNTGSLGGYLTYDEMLAELDEMRALYPDLITVRQAVSASLTTWQGRQLYYVRISDNADTDESEPELLYTGMHHAREPMSMMNLIYFMHYILQNYNSDPEIQDLVDNTEMYFIPCINPDGYEYNRTTNPNGGGMWRKNRRNNGNGTYGVDLNRNYGYQWGYNNSGSSPTPSSDTYRGPSAFSEPETQMLRDFCLAHEFVVALNDHSYGNYLVLPWGYINAVPESSLFTSIGNDLNDCNNFTVGNAFNTVGYYANGTSDDWMYGEQTTKEKIYAITPEIGSSGGGFWPAPSQIIPLCDGMMYTNLRMAYYARSLSCAAKDIVVTPASTSALVSWTAGAGSISYTVQYRQVGSSTWSSTTTGATSITLAGLTPCLQYEVQVKSICGDIDGQFSASLNFSTSGDPLPAGWTGANVGSTGTFGSQCFNSMTGTYSAMGGGSLSNTTTDGFRFIYATLNGNGSITAKINSLTTTNNNKAGVMIRESLANNARHASSVIARASGAWRSQFVRRTSTGGTATITQPSTTTTPPYWVRVVRSGNTFTGYISSNGTSWTQVSNASIGMAATAYIGLVVASGSTTAGANASISNVTTTGSVSLVTVDDRSENTDMPAAVESAAPPQLDIYPNPGVDRVNVRLHLEKSAVVDFQVTDLLGRAVLQLPTQQIAAGDSFQVIEIPPLTSEGMYWVRCNIQGEKPLIVRWAKGSAGY